MIFKGIGNIMDNLGDIRLFAEAANLGGLSAAGRKLGLSPAAASARLIKLESVLHTRLFERTTRHLRLTDEGRTYLGYCQQALQALDDGQALLQAGKSVVRGKVRISATSDFGRHVLKDWLDQFNKQYPEVTFALRGPWRPTGACCVHRLNIWRSMAPPSTRGTWSASTALSSARSA